MVHLLEDGLGIEGLQPLKSCTPRLALQGQEKPEKAEKTSLLTLGKISLASRPQGWTGSARQRRTD